MPTFTHNQDVLLTRQRHQADVMGLHYDYRIVVGDKAYSWATMHELPPLGGTQLLFEQPVHTASYAMSKKVIIPKGQYGAGVTTLDWVKRGKIRNPEEKEDQFSIVLRNKNRLFFKKLPEKYGANAWLFRHLPPKPESPIKVESAGNKYLEKIAYYTEEDSSFTHEGKEYNLNPLFSLTENSEVEHVLMDKLKWMIDNKTYSGDRVQNADVNIPGLIHKVGDREVILDGSHRLHKGVNEGLASLPYKRITKEMLAEALLNKEK